MAGKPYGSQMRLNGDGTVDIIGIDYDTRDIRIIAQNEDTIVLKLPARTGWSGNYQPRHYVGVEYLVFQILKTSKKSPAILDVKPLIRWDKQDEKKAKKGRT